MPPYAPWFGPWFIFPVMGLVLMVAFLFLVFGPRGPFAHMGGWGSGHGRSDPGPPGERPLEILKRRYARGEITREQFEQMRRDIE
jgi:putative membrane protein